MKHPKPTDNEIKLVKEKYIASRTDAKGIIEYGNDYFSKICGYSMEELIGVPHNIIRHPDMPKVVFKIMWQTIEKGEDIRAIVKNLTKDGSFYWVVTEFEPKIDPVTNEIVSHTAFRRHVPQSAINTMSAIYKKLLEIEKEDGVQASEEYLLDFLNQRNTTYDEFVKNLINKKGFFSRLLGI
ncbi:MAG: PAS domain-containing protein [Sulfurimonas sp.]|nr:PAS domain-containing protein [Sulfurimonas sp.]